MSEQPTNSRWSTRSVLDARMVALLAASGYHVSDWDIERNPPGVEVFGVPAGRYSQKRNAQWQAPPDVVLSVAAQYERWLLRTPFPAVAEGPPGTTLPGQGAVDQCSGDEGGRG